MHSKCPSPLLKVLAGLRSVALWMAALSPIAISAADQPLIRFQLPSFVGSGDCAACHTALSDAANNDVSIDTHWRSTMMANSARDPFWQAKVASEVLRNPGLKPVIEDKCATCHLPVARTQAVALRSPVGIHGDGFLNPVNGYHAAAMDGVSCALCHQVRSGNLGLSESFTGHYEIDTTTLPPFRPIYGPFPNPFVSQMQNNIGFTPVQGIHVLSSGLCGTCHNLRTPFVDASGRVLGEFPEQMIYSEWEHSGFNSAGGNGRSCQDCHMPPASGGVVLSNRGGPGLNLAARSPFGKHHFVGGNIFMLDLLAANAEALQVTASPVHFAATRQRTLDQMQNRTATLEQAFLAFDGDDLIIGLRAINHAGHKLPSGYPSRRTWIHFEVRDAHGAVFFSSGEPQPDGRIAGNDADYAAGGGEPHHGVITRPDQVQIYEALMENSDGEITYTLLRGARYRKDNRLLPAGFAKATASSEIIPSADALADGNFVGGSDEVVYRVNRSGRLGPFTVSVRLLYQAVAYAFAEDLLADAPADPAIAAFATLYEAAAKTPVVLAQIDVLADPSSTAALALSPESRTISSVGAIGQTIAVTSTSSWNATSNANWLFLTAGASGSGNGTVTYAASANTDVTSRMGTIAVDGRIHTVTQPAQSGTSTITGGSGALAGADIVHPNGNIYDQVLMMGPAVTVQAPTGKIVRTSFLDLSDDIVQVEFSGAGTVTIALVNSTGPALPTKYNQTVSYMKGHASIVVKGSDSASNLTVFSVGRMTAVNQALFSDSISYDGFADIVSISIEPSLMTGVGSFAGLRAANAHLWGTSGTVGLNAAGITFSGPLFAHEISAHDSATPMLKVASASDVRITGGDLEQPNGRAVQVDGFNRLQMAAGTDSHGGFYAAQPIRGRLERNGEDVTSELVPGS